MAKFGENNPWVKPFPPDAEFELDDGSESAFGKSCNLEDVEIVDLGGTFLPDRGDDDEEFGFFEGLKGPKIVKGPFYPFATNNFVQSNGYDGSSFMNDGAAAGSGGPGGGTGPAGTGTAPAADPSAGVGGAQGGADGTGSTDQSAAPGAPTFSQESNFDDDPCSKLQPGEKGYKKKLRQCKQKEKLARQHAKTENVRAKADVKRGKAYKAAMVGLSKSKQADASSAMASQLGSSLGAEDDGGDSKGSQIMGMPAGLVYAGIGLVAVGVVVAVAFAIKASTSSKTAGAK